MRVRVPQWPARALVLSARPILTINRLRRPEQRGAAEQEAVAVTTTSRVLIPELAICPPRRRFVRQLLEALDARELTRLQRLRRVEVPIIDELGFVPFERARP